MSDFPDFLKTDDAAWTYVQTELDVFDEGPNADWSRREAKQRAEEYAWFARDTLHRGSLTVYRMVCVEGPAVIQTHNLGKSWSKEKSAAGCYGVNASQSGREILIEGIVQASNIDWVFGFTSFMYYGESQWEVSMDADAPVLVIAIDGKTYESPVAGNTGHGARERWRAAEGRRVRARSNPISNTFPEGPLEAHAADFARRAHERVGQKRKYTGDPYIVHPGAVADIVRSVPHDEEMLAAAWLHDTVEDTGVLIDEIRREFGADVADLVGWLTDVVTPADGGRAARMEINLQHTAKAPPRAHTVKLADLINNSESILAHDRDFAMKYLREKWDTLGVLRDGDPTLWARAHQIVGDGLKALGIGVEHKIADLNLTARNLALVERYGQGTRRIVKIGKLPPEYRQAVSAYWEQPVEDVPVDLPVGITDLPMSALTKETMRDGHRSAEFQGDFAKYHRWFMIHHGAFTPMHKARWPVLLAMEEDDVEDGTLVDGMHRLNSYYAQGDKMVRAMWIIGFARAT